jgi:hypothetical protein
MTSCIVVSGCLVFGGINGFHHQYVSFATLKYQYDELCEYLAPKACFQDLLRHSMAPTNTGRVLVCRPV